MKKFKEGNKVDVLIKPQADIDTSDVTGATYFKMDGYREASVIAMAEGPGAGKILTVQLKQATAANGTGSKNLGSAVTATATASEDLVAVATALVEEMDHKNGFIYISATIGTDKGSAVDGSASLVRSKGRFSEAA